MTAGLEFSTFSLIGRGERTGMFPLVAYYNLRPRDPTVPPAAEWLAAQRRG